MPYFGYSRYPAKVRTRSIIRLVSAAFCCPSGRSRRRYSSSRSFVPGLRRPCSKRRRPSPGSWLLTLPRIVGTSVGGSLAPARPRDVDLAGAAHAVLVEEGSEGVARRAAARDARELVEEAVVAQPRPSTCCRNVTTSGCGRITSATSSSASPISDVTLCGTDCVSVSATFFSPSHSCEVLVEPPGGLHPRHDHLEAPRVEQDPLQLPEVGADEVEQRRSGHRPGCRARSAAMDARLRSMSSATSAGSASIGAGAAARRCPAGPRPGPAEEVAAVDDGLQRVPDQRVGAADDVQEPRAARR